MRAIIFLSVLTLYTAYLPAQKDKSTPLDTALEANSEKWKVKLHKGFGMGKPEFGPYATLNIDKVDSPVLRKKQRKVHPQM